LSERLAAGRVLPADALRDALEGLEREEITGQGGLLAQLAGRVIDAALAGVVKDHRDPSELLMGIPHLLSVHRAVVQGGPLPVRPRRLPPTLPYPTKTRSGSHLA